MDANPLSHRFDEFRAGFNEPFLKRWDIHGRGFRCGLTLSHTGPAPECKPDGQPPLAGAAR